MNARREFKFDEPEGLLAHYTTAAVTFEHILPERRLRMSPYRSMRDPAENKDIAPGTEYPGNDDEAATDARDYVIGRIKRVRDACRVLSLTHEAPESARYGCSWARPRMWEQYADDHRGACLMFDRERLQRVLEAELKAVGPVYVGEVRYTPAGLAESAARSIIRISDDPARNRGVVADYFQANRDDLFFLKNSHFATEYEYRAVLVGSGDGYHYMAYADAIVGVVVGERFPRWQVPGAREACRSAGFPLRKIDWRHGRPVAVLLDHIP